MKLIDKFHWSDNEKEIKSKLKQERIKFFDRINDLASKFHDEVREVFSSYSGKLKEDFGGVQRPLERYLGNLWYRPSMVFYREHWNHGEFRPMTWDDVFKWLKRNRSIHEKK